jgi:hypothetical protein
VRPGSNGTDGTDGTDGTLVAESTSVAGPLDWERVDPSRAMSR